MLLKNHRRYFPNSSFVKLTVSKNNNPDINQILKRSGEFIKPLVLDRLSRIIELRNDEDFFQGLLPKKRRTNLRRAIKLLSQIGLLTTEHLQPAREEAVNESWKRFLAIYRQSWKHTSARSITGTLAEHNFFHQIFRRFSREQKLYCSFLKLNDMDIAVSWSVKHGNTCYGLQTAYITDYENASPGAICMTEHLIDYFSHSGKRFDLMGEHPYKNKISNLATSYCDYYLFFNGPYSTILHKLSRFSPLPFRQL